MEASTDPFLRRFRASMAQNRPKQAKDRPNYYTRPGDTPSRSPATGAGSSQQLPPAPAPAHSLETAGTPVRRFHLGTGLSIYRNAIVPALRSARREVILVTCFWADSASKSGLGDALADIASRRTAELGALPPGSRLAPLRVRLCFSMGDASTIKTVLTHPASPSGYLRDPGTWPALGLPPESVMREAHIDLAVKSIFFRPVSVLHPKFVVVDRSRAWIPSCNVSWEDWFEGCLEIEGPQSVQKIVDFYQAVWEPDLPALDPLPEGATTETLAGGAGEAPSSAADSSQQSVIPGASMTVDFGSETATTVFLPSPHHKNPRFRLLQVFPIPLVRFLLSALPLRHRKTLDGYSSMVASYFSTSHASYPATPLNLALSDLFRNAESSIFIQTPNITALPAIGAVVAALSNGVDVKIVLSKRLMLLEQLATAFGWTSGWAVRTLTSIHSSLKSAAQTERESVDGPDLELGRPRVGRLTIEYFRPASTAPNPDKLYPEPVKTHLKLTIVDQKYSVFGSGNMDRASWYTSQEIGYLVCSSPIALRVRGAVEAALEGRTELVYDN